MIKKFELKKERIERKKTRIRKRIRGTSECPRLAVFRSSKHIYAQIIDDVSGKTLIAVSSLSGELKDELAKAKNPIERSKFIGIAIAKKALEKNIKKIVFDRRAYKYHGRVKALAEGAREGGLQF